MNLAVSILATDGPFGPTYATCLLLPVMVLGPFILILLSGYSVLRPDPSPLWLLVLIVVGDLALAYTLWPMGDPRMKGFWRMWYFAGIGAELTLPIVGIAEWYKRRACRL
jgi:hypothetical protein